jgi:hypothetical protein
LPDSSKKTILLAGVALKLVPVIVTDVPTGPEIGEKEFIVGWANRSEATKLMEEKIVWLFNSHNGQFLF